MADFEKFVVGLGNPGSEYEKTPHNLGFLVVDRLAERNNIRVVRKDAMALVGQGEILGRRVIVAKPQTFMNLSGQSVKGLMVKHELSAEDLIVVHDELDLPWKSLRIRPDGSSGGHNGIKDIIEKIGTKSFARVRLGIHGGQRSGDGARIVLGELSRVQWKEMDELLDLAALAVESIIAEGVEKSMTKYNRRAQGLNPEEE